MKKGRKEKKNADLYKRRKKERKKEKKNLKRKVK